MLRALLDPLLSVIYPQECHVCGEAVDSIGDGVACVDCWNRTRLFDPGDKLCDRCGALPLGRENSCRECTNAEFDRAIAAGVYEHALAATLLRLKSMPHLPDHARKAFKKRLANCEFAERSVIVPVPLSRRRKFERGFNQAEILAEIVSGVTGLPILSSCLARKTHTNFHRVAMDKTEREKSVEKAFEVRAPRLIEGCEVLLVDDVLTSGNTASACALALKKKGAASVTVITLARAVMRN